MGEKKEPVLVLTYEIPRNFKKSTNLIYKWVHWALRKQVADYFHNISAEDCSECVSIDFLVVIEFKFFFKSKYLDHLNLAFMAKAIEDWLVGNGLLKNDTNEFVDSVLLKTVRMDEKERRKMDFDFVEIEIFKAE